MSQKPSLQTSLHNPTDVKSDIDERLNTYFAGQYDAAAKLDPAYGDLWAVTGAMALAGGKRLRPYMTVLCYEVYGGSDYATILEVALAEELLHVSLLIHDDIVDKDYVRHGVLNVAGQYQAKYASYRRSSRVIDHFADSAALMAGDLLLSAAHSRLALAGLSFEDQTAVLRLFGEMTFEVAGGQHLDMEAVLGSLEAADPLHIARHKTAGYSFVGPLQCGAILAHAPETDLQHLRHIGYSIGIAFQLTDDLLGVFGDERQTGKSSSNDLREGKRTLLAKETYSRAEPSQRKRFKALFGKDSLDDAQAQELRDMMVASGALAEVERLIEQYSQVAQTTIKQLSVSATAQQSLSAFLTRVTNRKR